MQYLLVFRWACSTIERGYAPSDATELRAIASFHHPQGFAYGYIRMVMQIGKILRYENPIPF